MKVRIEWAGERLELWSERAVFWPRTRSLLIADPHFGKPAAFRSAGMHVPEEVTRHDLARLDSLLRATGARRLGILGDFFHAWTGRSPETLEALEAWRARRRSLEILLVRGNHDRGAGDPPGAWKIRVVAAPHGEPPFVFRHEPVESDEEGEFVVAGHLHPAVALRDDAGGHLRVPCFSFGSRLALLPAFGSFTGTARILPRRGDRIFALGPEAIVEIQGPDAARTGG